MQPTTYPNVSNIYAPGGSSVVPSASGGFGSPDVSNIYASPSQSVVPSAQQEPSKENGNWFTNLLPTFGSMGGGAAGAMAGAAAGSFIPIIGTGIGGILGGILGAAAGGGGARPRSRAEAAPGRR